MTKKDFIKLADHVKHHKPNASQSLTPFEEGWETGRYTQWIGMRDSLADMLAAANPRFNRVLWLGYVNGECTANGGKVAAA